MVNYNELVSVVFVLEGDIDTTLNLFRNVREQTYKNVEYVFVHPQNFDIEKFKEEIYNQTDLGYDTPVQFVQGDYGIGLIDFGIEKANAQIIFLKTTGPILWYPGHIEAHLKKHQENKYKRSLVLSLIEIKNAYINHKSPLSTVTYRYKNKIQPNELLVDEISFTKDMPLHFKDYCMAVDEKNNIVEANTPGARLVYDPRKLLDHIKSLGGLKFADSISVITLIPIQDPNQSNKIVLSQPDWLAIQTEQSVNDDFTIRHRVPTLFGNTQIDQQWNDAIRSFIAKYSEDIKKCDDQRIIVKRTVGMGDVIEIEPVLRYLKKEYPKAELWFVTADSRGCAEILQCFDTKPDRILKIPEQIMFQDVLGRTNLPKLLEENGLDRELQFDLRFDFDLAYESRPKTRFVDAYFKMIGVDTNQLTHYDLIPVFDNQMMLFDLEENTKQIAVCLNGSGWESKELNAYDVQYILNQLKLHGYSLVHTSPLPEKYITVRHLFDLINDENDFQTMICEIQRSIGFVGADNGPMHIASALNKEIFVWNGSASSKMTTAYPELTILEHSELSCIGCKHEQFYNLIQLPNNQVSITFVPECKNPSKFACMKSFKNKDIDQQLEKFLKHINYNEQQ